MSANVRFGVFLGCKIISWKNNQDEKVLGAASFEGFLYAKVASVHAYKT